MDYIRSSYEDLGNGTRTGTMPPIVPAVVICLTWGRDEDVWRDTTVNETNKQEIA